MPSSSMKWTAAAVLSACFACTCRASPVPLGFSPLQPSPRSSSSSSSEDIAAPSTALTLNFQQRRVHSRHGSEDKRSKRRWLLEQMDNLHTRSVDVVTDFERRAVDVQQEVYNLYDAR